jgi:uncharacterized protein (DUF58 family)
MGSDEAERDSGSVFGYGISMALLAILLLVAEASSSLDLATFLAATLALMLVLRLAGRIALLRLAVSPSREVYRLFAGDCFEVRVDFANRKFLPVLARLELHGPEGLSQISRLNQGPQDFSLGLQDFSLGPFERKSLSWPFRAGRRGLSKIGAATLSAGDRLGLYRRAKEIGVEGEVVVFPRLRRIEALELPFRDYFGIHPSKGIIEDPSWYEGTREYRGLRSARSIHGKASAHLGILQEKIFEPTSQLKVVFLLDGRGFLEAEDGGGFEEALEIIASAASSFSDKGASFAIAVDRSVQGYPAVLPFGRGPEHLGCILELLARCEREEGQGVLRLLGEIGASGSGFIVVARSPDEGTRRYFSLPAIRRDRILFLFKDGASAREGYPSLSFSEVLEARE